MHPILGLYSQSLTWPSEKELCSAWERQDQGVNARAPSKAHSKMRRLREYHIHLFSPLGVEIAQTLSSFIFGIFCFAIIGFVNLLPSFVQQIFVLR